MSEVKVNKVSPRSGTTVTIGDSGDTINIVGTLQNNGSPLAGDISSVVAGTGLSGGATSGVATLNIEAAQPTITSLGTITGFTSTGIDDNADATAITIDSSENVGIKNTTPSNFNASARQLVVGSGSGDNGITIFAGNTNNSSLFLADGTTGTNGYRGSVNYLHNGDALTLHANATETMRLTNGKVGIGTSSPGANLEISSGSYGSSNQHQQWSYNGTPFLSVYMDAYASPYFDTDSTSSWNPGATMVFKRQGSEKFRITNTGLVGIGTSTPQEFLDISDNGPRIRFSDTSITNLRHLIGSEANDLEISCDVGNVDSNSHIRFKVDNSEKMRITNTGSVGIGTSSPSEKLEVNGTVKATGFDGSTPMVYAQGNSGTSCADNTFTKITLDNEIIDTQGLFANSRFTVTSGYEGKYLIIWQISFNHTSTAKTVIGGIYKNGSIIAYGQGFSAKSSNHTMIERTSIITDLTTNDYIEFYGRHDTGSTKSNNSGIYTNASITKLID